MRIQEVLEDGKAEDSVAEELLATEDVVVAESCRTGQQCYADEAKFATAVVIWSIVRVSR